MREMSMNKTSRGPGSLLQRPRRNRRSQAIRDLASETTLTARNLILPLFVTEGKKQRVPIAAMPGQSRLSIDNLVATCKEAVELGIPAVALFPVIEDQLKDRLASEAKNPSGLLQRAIAE